MSNGHRPSRGDMVSIAAFMVAGAAIAVWTLARTVARIVEAVRNTDVSVHASFVHTRADLPLGPEGSPVEVNVDTAFVTVPSLPGGAVGVAVLEAAVHAATILVIVACLLLLSRNILRGRVFSRGNTRLVTLTGMVALVGFGVSIALGNAVASEALRHTSGGSFTGAAVLDVPVFPFVLGAFAFAAISTAFVVGERLQRDTEGLV